jgi:hypothetical protein
MYCPHKGNRSELLHEAEQGDKAQTGQALVRETAVVASADRIELHRAEAHSGPSIEQPKLTVDGTKGRSEEMGKANDNPIEVTNDVLVEIVMADGKRANPIFEFLHGLWTDRGGVGGEGEANEGEALAEGGDTGFVGGKGET